MALDHANRDIASGSPLVSVIVTAYNRAHLLPRVFESLAGQSLRDFEIIVVDDASTDDTEELVQRFANAQLHYIRHEHNRGAVQAYNTGILAARGEFIACLDSDDTVRPLWLERQVECIGRDPAIGMVWGWIRIHGSDGSSAIMYRDPFGSRPRTPLPTMLNWTPGIGSSMLRRAVFDDIGFLDPAVGHMLDVDITTRFALSERFTIDIVPEVLMDIYKDTSSLSGHLSPRYLSELRNYVAKHEASFAAYPCLHAANLYRIGRVMEQLGENGSDAYIREAIRHCPGQLRFRAYPLARDLGMLAAWNRLSTLRTSTRAMYRNLRHSR